MSILAEPLVGAVSDFLALQRENEIPTRPATTASTARKNAGFGFPDALAIFPTYAF
jgi:hypothetical protein